MKIKSILFNLLLLMTAGLHANIGTYGFKPFPNTYFVETGTYEGGGVKQALKANCFKAIYSIEAHFPAFRNCKQYFAHNKNVHLFHGDSQNGLWNMIKHLNGTITFWLDAHIFPPVNDGRKNAPLLEELDQIKRHHIKTHTILIDDLSCCGSLAFDYLTLDDLKNKILEINPNYTFELLAGGDADEVANNILLAYIK
jgi:hypothetical protein